MSKANNWGRVFEKHAPRCLFTPISDILYILEKAMIEHMPENLAIKKGKPEEIKDLARIFMEAYQGIERYGEDSLSDAKRYLKWLYRTCDEGFLVAETGGQLVGLIAACPEWRDRELGMVLEIHEIVIRPIWQGKGLGKNLLERAYELGRTRGRKIVALWVGKGNIRARNWYVRLGFEERCQWGEWVRLFRSIPGTKDEEKQLEVG